MDVYVKLVVAAVTDPTSIGISFLLYSDYDFPYYTLTEDYKIDEVAYKLLYDYTGIGRQWVNLVQIGAFQTFHNKIDIVYGCMIPELIEPNRESIKWYTYAELINKLLPQNLDIIQKTAARL